MSKCIVLHLVSQGRAVKAYGLEVKAPTGHRSITFPDSSDLKSFSTYVPTCMSLPLPVVPKSSTPATSLANLRKSNQSHNLSVYLNTCNKIIPLLFYCVVPDTASAVNTPGHYCLHQRSDILVLNSPEKKTNSQCNKGLASVQCMKLCDLCSIQS